MEEELTVVCPHCNGLFIIEQLNCCIFRHGILKSTNKQMNPHLSEVECKKLIESNEIYGCGKPLLYNKTTKKTEVCSYSL